jgi:hypothetical protein
MSNNPEYLKFYLEEENNHNKSSQEILKISPTDQNLLNILAFYINKSFPQILKNYRFIKNIVDLNNPEKWYPEARKIKRTIYYHMGPTNSGKTHHAIKSLMNARTGLYCAPLRLLAWEIQEKLLKNNVKCNLITGQERDLIENATHISCTVEKTDIKNNFDCAVIDEIQMINDSYRGNAWTEAFLGIKAKEIHLCGDPRALKLISYLCQCTGDDLIKINYNRLGRLEVEEKPLKNFTDLRQGDCVIGFSKRKLLHIRKSISVKECGVIYGHLPPKTKKEQVGLFNLDSKQDGYGIKYLCATDAIGLGLNLNIKRIIFSSLEKNVNSQKILISQSEIKQIAGRAGRSSNTGYVTAFEEKDLHLIRESLKDVNLSVGRSEDHGTQTNILKDGILCYNFQNSEVEKEIKVAYIYPPLEILLEFASIYCRIFNQNLENKEDLKKSVEKSQIFENLDKNENNLTDNSFRLSFSDAIKLFKSYSNVGNHFIFKDLFKFLLIAENLEKETKSKYDLKTLYHFLNAPIRLSETTKFFHRLYLRQMNNDGIVKVPFEFEQITKEKIDSMSQSEGGPNISNNTHCNKVDVKFLQYLEDVYNCLEIYIFLSHRFESSFIDRTKGENLKNHIAELIEYIIEEKEITNLSGMGKSEFMKVKNFKHPSKEPKLTNKKFERLEENKAPPRLNDFNPNLLI